MAKQRGCFSNAFGCLVILILAIVGINWVFTNVEAPNLPDFTLPEPAPWKERDASSLALLYAQEAAEQNLKAPATAEWPGMFESAEHAAHIGDQVYSVRSWVDAENTFGAKLRMWYNADLKQVGDNQWQLINFSFEE